MRSYDEELNSILDIAGLPTGRGAGYGVGVADDELPALDLRLVPTNMGTDGCLVCVWCLEGHFGITVDGFLASNKWYIVTCGESGP
jgi:hypothetical protein